MMDFLFGFNLGLISGSSGRSQEPYQAPIRRGKIQYSAVFSCINCKRPHSYFLFENGGCVVYCQCGFSHAFYGERRGMK